MNYRIELYETFDSNGVSIVNLFPQINSQIYDVILRYVEDGDKYKTIAKCFKDIGKMIKVRKK